MPIVTGIFLSMNEIFSFTKELGRIIHETRDYIEEYAKIRESLRA